MGTQLEIMREFIDSIAEQCMIEFIKRTGITDKNYIIKLGATVFRNNWYAIGQAVMDAISMPTDELGMSVIRELVYKLVDEMILLHLTGGIYSRP